MVEQALQPFDDLGCDLGVDYLLSARQIWVVAHADRQVLLVGHLPICRTADQQRSVAVGQITRHSHLSQLEGNGTGVTDDSRTDFDQPGLQAGQRPVSHLLWQVSALQEDPEIVGQRMKLKPHLVLRHALARQAGPVDRLLTFLDMLLRGATLIVETDNPVWFHWQIGDDEADAGNPHQLRIRLRRTRELLHFVVVDAARS